MFTVFNGNSDRITIECPACRTTKSVQKSTIKNFEKRHFIRFKCTCGSSFNKRIGKKDPSEVDLISAIFQLDFSVLWYKILHPLAFLNG